MTDMQFADARTPGHSVHCANLCVTYSMRRTAKTELVLVFHILYTIRDMGASSVDL